MTDSHYTTFCFVSLLIGIRHRNHLTVLEALKALDADPNEYFNVPTSYLPWILSAPFQHPYGASSFPPLPCLPSHLRVHPLHLAVAVSTQAVVRTLLDWGACINALDSFNRNPLHIIIQPPPIDLPYEQGDKKRETFAELPSKLTDTSVEDTYRKLSHFLYKQAGKRTSNEVKIASLLCSRGVDLTRCDMWGRSCVDYATDWLRINRLMRLGRIRLSQLPPPDRLMSLSDINAQSDLSCPVPMRPQCNISSVVSIQISNRIPHEVIDVVLLYEDRLRLLAMSPVIGLDVGGNISPRRHIHFGEPSSRNQTSSHDVKQSAVVKGSIPLASPACTPIRSVTPQAFGKVLFSHSLTCYIVHNASGCIVFQPHQEPLWEAVFCRNAPTTGLHCLNDVVYTSSEPRHRTVYKVSLAFVHPLLVSPN